MFSTFKLGHGSLIFDKCCQKEKRGKCMQKKKILDLKIKGSKKKKKLVKSTEPSSP